MKYIKYILPFYLLPLLVMSQARVNITSGYMKIGVTNNGTSATKTYVVLDDSATTALSASAGAGIVSSGEFNMLQWDIGKSTGTFTLPWVSDNHTAIPLSINISAAGVNSTNGKNGAIEFSTWHTTADNASGTISITGLPIDPGAGCNMFPSYLWGSSPTATDDSYNVVDRFWIIDAGLNTTYVGSGAKSYKPASLPTMAITFTYLGAGNAASEVSSPNVFTDGALIAQRFNPTSLVWSDYLPTTNSNTAGGSTSTLVTNTIPNSELYRDWTLSSKKNPLPISLLYFTAECSNGKALLQWSTATESNNDYFTVERTSDGVNYEVVRVVKGAGNSTNTLNYSCTDNSPLPGTSYYRLSQTDLNGNTVIVSTVAYVACGDQNVTTLNAFGTSGYIDVQINSVENSNSNYTVTLSNDIGQILLNEGVTAVMGYNEFKLPANVSEGVYFITVSNNVNVFHKKILLKNN